MAKPNIAVVTKISPTHLKYFKNTDGVFREKSKLVASLKSADYAILNHDDPAVYGMHEKTKAKVMSYGFSEGSSIRVSNFDFRFDQNKIPEGVGFKVNYGVNTFVPFNIHGSLGKSQAMAVGAAVCAGIIYEMNLIEISQALDSYNGPNGRLKILKGIKNH